MRMVFLFLVTATTITSNSDATVCLEQQLILTCTGQGASQRWIIMKGGLFTQCSFVSGGRPGMLCLGVIPATGLYNLTIQLHSIEHQHFVSSLSTVTNMSLNNTMIECTTGPSRDMTTIRIIRGIQASGMICIIYVAL